MNSLKIKILVLFLISGFVLQAKTFQMKTSSELVECFDFVELTFLTKKLKVQNPFTDVSVVAVFTSDDGVKNTVEGFCDEASGKIFKVRYMPRTAGVYNFTVEIKIKGKSEKYTGIFTVVKSERNGPIRVDAVNPWHFIYENTGKHYFWNSTTTYWMLGWKDDKIITDAIDRLAGYDINRIRVAMNGRAHGGSRWYEDNVVESEKFTFKLNPWLAERPDDLDNPGFDVTRFNLKHWQKLDRLLLRAREKGIIVSLIYYVDGLDHGCDPFKKTNMGNEDEQRYYRFAIARYSGFENIMWDVTNEYHLFRSDEWVEKMGKLIQEKDPAKHLISVHGHSDFPFRASSWVDVVMFQSWDECGGYNFIADSREKQKATGRILPQINEEYGYEQHYSPWGCGATAGKERPDGRSAENRVQLAWEICMAGGYQTTGERADFGTGAGEDTGGGWINGRGNEKMTMLRYYKIMKDIFEQTEYWKLTPANQLVSFGNLCLAEEGKQYLIYSRVQHCRLYLPAGQKYKVWKINPNTGESEQLADADSDVDNFAWQYRRNLDENTVFILKRINE